MMTAVPGGDWNFTTFGKYVDQRFDALQAQLLERYSAQQIGVAAALASAEKAVQAALTAAEKAVDKAESAQQLRNEAQNEFRQSLSDLSGLMWTTKEGTAAIDSLRREVSVSFRALENRVGTLETGAANIQGRIWAVSSLFAMAAVGIEVGLRLIH